MIKACVFDLDGTLIDSLGDLAASGNYALKQNGYPERSITEFRSYLGDGVRELVKRSIPEAERNDGNISKVMREMLDYYSEHLLDNTRLYNGVVPLIKVLQTKDIRLFIYTNKYHYQAVEIVSRVFGQDVFEVVGLKPNGERKPDTKAILDSILRLGLGTEECVFIGDAPVDMITAKKAGMYAVGAAWGYHATEKLIKAGADFMADTPLDVLSFLYRYVESGNEK